MNKVQKVILGLLLFLMGISIIYNWKDNLYKEKFFYSESKTDNIEWHPCTQVVQTFCSNEEKLYDLSFLFDTVSQATEEYILIEIFREERCIYTAKLSYNKLKEGDWTSIYTNIPLEKNQEYSIHMTAGNMESVPLIGVVSTENAISESKKLIMEDEIIGKQLGMRLGYYEHRNVADKAKSIAKLFIVFGILFICVFLLAYIQRLIRKLIEKVICPLYSCPYAVIWGTIYQYILFTIWMIFGGNTVEFPIKIIALIISAVTMKDLPEKIEYLKKKAENPSFSVAFMLSVFYSGFVVMGSEGLIYPLNASLSLGRIFVFGVICIWFIPVLMTFLRWYDGFSTKKDKTDDKASKMFRISCAFILAVFPIVTLIAFNPGIISEDTVTCLATYAHNIIGMPNWHPPFYILCLKGIISVWDSTYAVVLVQILFWILIMLQMLSFLYKKGISEKILYLVACIMGISIPNAMYLCSIWKDIPYSIALLWLTVIIARLILDKQNKIALYVSLVISLIFVCLLRQNGIVPYIAVVIALGIALRNNRKVLSSLIMSIGLILLIQGPIYSSLGVVEPEEKGGKYIGLSQELMGVYYSGGDVSEDTVTMINVLSRYSVNRNSFYPYWSSASYDLDVPVGSFIINYIDTFIHNPIMVIREVLCRNDCIWHVFPAKDSIVNLVNYQGEEWGEEWQQYYPNRINNRLTGVLGGDSGFSADSQLYTIMFWRSGLHVLFVIWCMLSLIGHGKNKAWIIFIPFIGQIVSLLLSTGWSDFRYYWPLNIIGVFLIMIIPILKQEK